MLCKMDSQATTTTGNQKGPVFNGGPLAALKIQLVNLKNMAVIIFKKYGRCFFKSQTI